MAAMCKLNGGLGDRRQWGAPSCWAAESFAIQGVGLTQGKHFIFTEVQFSAAYTVCCGYKTKIEIGGKKITSTVVL